MRPFTACLALGLAASLMTTAAQAQPGPSPLVSTWVAGSPAGSGTGNWNVGTNWSAGTVPSVTAEDAAIINGGGTAQVNSVIGPQVGSVVLGQGTATGESGTLEIQSGGNLTVVDDPTFPADGSVRVGQNAGQGVLAGTTTANPQAGTGTLRVLPGGTLNAWSLTLGGTVNSMMTLGGTGAGTATVNLTNNGAVTLGRTTRVIGPNVNFTSSGATAGITLQGTSVFIPEITGATHSPLKTTGNVALGGTLQPDFNGVTPTLGQSWNIFDAATVSGAFASVLPDPDVALGLGQVVATRTVSGGMNGQLVQMFVRQLPVLNVNRTTGAASITNPGTGGIELDAYTIQSNSGSLSLANWQSLEDNPGVAGAGWFEGNPSANRLSELRSSGTSTLGASGSWPLGNIFQPMPTEFGQTLEDLVFQFNDPVTQSTVNGVVNYTGVGPINNLVLFADPATGNVKIRNTSPFTVAIDGYTISSAAGSLNSNPALWTSLQDQPGVTPNWFEANLSDNRVSEVMSQGTTTLNPNSSTTFDLGGLFKTGGAQDLVFEFLLANSSQPTTGLVLYQAAPPVGLPGDFDGNGSVGNSDLTLLLNNWGATVPPVPAGWTGAQPTEPGIGNDELTALLNTWGQSSGGGSSLVASAVPEPGSWLLVVSGLAWLAASRRRAQIS